MDTTTQLGTLGESKVMTYLVEKGYDVFIQLSGKAPFDLLAHKNGKLQRVEVKTTNTKNDYGDGFWVQLASSRHNTKKNTIYPFDNTEMDILGIYIKPIDKVLLLRSKTITAKFRWCVNDVFIKHYDDFIDHMWSNNHRWGTGPRAYKRNALKVQQQLDKQIEQLVSTETIS